MNGEYMNLLVYALDVYPNSEGKGFGLGNVIKNIYPRLNIPHQIFSDNLNLSTQKLSNTNAEILKWKDVATLTSPMVKPDTILHSHDSPTNVAPYLLKGIYEQNVWIHHYHILFSSKRFNKERNASIPTTKVNLHKNLSYPSYSSNFVMEDFSTVKIYNEYDSYKKADYLVFNSNFLKNEMEDLWGEELAMRWRNETTFVIPNGFDEKVFYQKTKIENKDFREKLSLKEEDKDKKIIFFAGRNIPHKRGDIVFNMGYDRYIAKNYVIVMAGDSSLQKPIIQSMWNTNVYRYPKVDQNTLNSLYNVSDYIMFPSDYEPFGQVAIEAMASGSVVLIPTNQGFDEFATNENSFRVGKNRVDYYVDAIKQLDVEPNRAKSIKINAMKTANEYHWSKIVPMYSDMYREVRPKNIDYVLLKKAIDQNEVAQHLDNIELDDDIYTQRVDFITKYLKGNVLDVGADRKRNWDKYKTNKDIQTLKGLDLADNDEEVGYGIGEFIPYSDNSFDTVIVGEILEHSYHSYEIVREAIRVSKERIVLTVPINVFDYGHVSNPDPSVVKSILEKEGYSLEIKELKYEGDKASSFSIYMFYANKNKQSLGSI
jgi:glycosyltransferase involved in cell wall biosynthesis